MDHQTLAIHLARKTGSFVLSIRFVGPDDPSSLVCPVRSFIDPSSKARSPVRSALAPSRNCQEPLVGNIVPSAQGRDIKRYEDVMYHDLFVGPCDGLSTCRWPFRREAYRLAPAVLTELISMCEVKVEVDVSIGSRPFSTEDGRSRLAEIVPRHQSWESWLSRSWSHRLSLSTRRLNNMVEIQ